MWFKVIVYGILFAAGSFSGFMAFSLINRKKLDYLTDKSAQRKQRLKKLNFEVEVASSQISSVSEQLYITLDDNNALAQQLFAEGKEMASLNEEANSNVHAIISHVKNIMEMMEESKSTSDELKQISASSYEVVKSSLGDILEVVNIISDIKESSDYTIKYITKLNNSSREIAKILETVNRISTQTHLLALNATIESARAGEAGKGFAVVAEEIGKLALETNGAVKDINGLIKNIQNEVEGVNSIVHENSESVAKGVSASKSIEGDLNNIEKSYEEVIKKVKNINELSGKGVQYSHDVGNKIEGVENILGLTAKSVEDVYNSVQRQKQSVEEIAEMGERLKNASESVMSLVDNTETINLEGINRDQIQKAVESFRVISKEIYKNEIFLSMDKPIHRELIKKIIEDNKFIEASWTNDIRGRFVCSIPEAGIANASVREWFKKSVTGEEYISPVYISAITRNPCITISAPIKYKSGEIVGVFGIDVKLGK